MVLKNACNILDQELAEAVNRDTKKNEIFVDTRAQIEEIIKAVKHHIKDARKELDILKNNNDTQRSVTEIMKTKISETKTGTFPINHEGEVEEHKGEIVSNKKYIELF